MNQELITHAYQIGNVIYNVTETAETHAQLQNDVGFFKEYVAYDPPTECVAFVEDVPGEEAEELPSAVSDEIPTAVSAEIPRAAADEIPRAVAKELPRTVNEEAQRPSGFIWTRESTNFLLDAYGRRKENFRDPRQKKKDLWSQILNEMKDAGYEIGGEHIVDTKMRNLKKRYKDLKDNKNTTGRARLSWPYMDKLEEIFAEDRTINFGPTLSSMETAHCSSELRDSEEAQSPSACVSLTRGNRLSLYAMRKKQLQIEERKVKIAELLQKALEELIQIGKARNDLLERYLMRNSL